MDEEKREEENRKERQSIRRKNDKFRNRMNEVVGDDDDNSTSSYTFGRSATKKTKNEVNPNDGDSNNSNYPEGNNHPMEIVNQSPTNKSKKIQESMNLVAHYESQMRMHALAFASAASNAALAAAQLATSYGDSSEKMETEAEKNCYDINKEAFDTAKAVRDMCQQQQQRQQCKQCKQRRRCSGEDISTIEDFMTSSITPSPMPHKKRHHFTVESDTQHIPQRQYTDSFMNPQPCQIHQQQHQQPPFHPPGLQIPYYSFGSCAFSPPPTFQHQPFYSQPPPPPLPETHFIHAHPHLYSPSFINSPFPPTNVFSTTPSSLSSPSNSVFLPTNLPPPPPPPLPPMMDISPCKTPQKSSSRSTTPPLDERSCESQGGGTNKRRLPSSLQHDLESKSNKQDDGVLYQSWRNVRQSLPTQNNKKRSGNYNTTTSSEYHHSYKGRTRIMHSSSLAASEQVKTNSSVIQKTFHPLGKTGIAALYEYCSKRQHWDHPKFIEISSFKKCKFTIQVMIQQEVLGCGHGSTKNAAKQDAARQALKHFFKQNIRFDENGVVCFFSQSKITPDTANSASSLNDAEKKDSQNQRGSSTCSTLLHTLCQINDNILKAPHFSYIEVPFKKLSDSQKRGNFQNSEIPCFSLSSSSTANSCFRNNRSTYSCTATIFLREPIKPNNNKRKTMETTTSANSQHILSSKGTGASKREAKHMASANLLALLFPNCSNTEEVMEAAGKAKELYKKKKFPERIELNLSLYDSVVEFLFFQLS